MMKYMLPTLTMAMLITVSVMAQSGHEGHDHSDKAVVFESFNKPYLSVLFS